MFETLIEYKQLEECSGELFGFSDVTFKRDFGPWKQGDNVESLWFKLEDSLVEECSSDGNTIKKCKFKLEAD